MRIGPSHQAGSDSLLTAATFFKMRELYFNDRIDDAEYNGKLYGLGQTVPATLTLTNGHLTLTEPGSGMGLGLRSGATIAERERAPLTRDAQGQGQQGANQSAMGAGGLPTPGLGAFPSALTAPYAMNGSFMRQINVGGDR